MPSLEDELRETQANFHEFRQASKLLEEELESEVDRLESENQALSSKYQRVLHDLEAAQDRLKANDSAHDAQLESLHAMLEKVQNEKDMFFHKVIELESELDHSHNQHRILASSLNECEAKYNQLLELKTDLETSFETQTYTSSIAALLKKVQEMSLTCTCTSDQKGIFDCIYEINKHIQQLESHLTTCQSMLQSFTHRSS